MALSTKPRVLIAGGLIACGPTLALAQAAENKPAPRLDIDVLVEVQNDGGIESDVSGNERNELFNTTETFLSFKGTERFKIESLLVVEPVRGPSPGEDRFFEDHGLYAEELYAAYETDAFGVKAGKYNATFGTAWDMAPGIYGADFAEDYELVERIGAAGSLIFGDGGIGGSGYGTHTLTVNTFFADTSFLSKSAFTGRGDLDKSDGGPSNTESLSSFSVTLDGGGFETAPLHYHLGTRYQEGGPGTPEDETGFVAGVSGSFSVSPHIDIEPIAEVAYFDNFGGVQQDATYATAGTALVRGPWNVAASYTGRFIDTSGSGDTDDTLAQLSAGYAFKNGLTLDAGYRYENTADVETHIVGALVTYNFNKSIY